MLPASGLPLNPYYSATDHLKAERMFLANEGQRNQIGGVADSMRFHRTEDAPVLFTPRVLHNVDK